MLHEFEDFGALGRDRRIRSAAVLIVMFLAVSAVLGILYGEGNTLLGLLSLSSLPVLTIVTLYIAVEQSEEPIPLKSVAVLLSLLAAVYAIGAGSILWTAVIPVFASTQEMEVVSGLGTGVLVFLVTYFWVFQQSET